MIFEDLFFFRPVFLFFSVTGVCLM